MIHKKILLASILGFLLSALPQLSAQCPAVGVSGDIPLGKLDEMEQELAQADAHQRVGLLSRLGIDSAIAQRATQTPLPGEAIALRPIRTSGAAHDGIAFLPSGGSTECYLYLLQGSDENPQKEPWHVVGQQQLDCWDMAATFEIMPLRAADVDDVVVHHVNLGHGSGYAKDQTQVFSILDGKLLQTLATEDSLLQVTAGAADATLNRASTFMRFPDNSLEETRSSTYNDKLKKVERRSWRWSERKRRFLPGRLRLITPPVN